MIYRCENPLGKKSCRFVNLAGTHWSKKRNFAQPPGMNPALIVKKPFSVIFVCEDSDKVFDVEVNGEYWAKAPIQFGVDIKTIATDTDKHQSILQQYCDHYGLQVRVILFDDLTSQTTTAALDDFKQENKQKKSILPFLNPVCLQSIGLDQRGWRKLKNLY